MDLGAYCNIGDETIEKIVNDNGISVPRLRGYRLMKDESPLDLDDWLKDSEVEAVEDLIRGKWHTNPWFFEYSNSIDRKIKYYIDKDCGVVRWSRIHGKKRKNARFAIKKKRKAIIKQVSMFNKYVGRDDVLYIHCRLGSHGWTAYLMDEEVRNQSWYLDSCDDYYDPSYADVYARIKV